MERKQGTSAPVFVGEQWYLALQDEVARFNYALTHWPITPVIYREGHAYRIIAAEFALDRIWLTCVQMELHPLYRTQFLPQVGHMIWPCEREEEWQALLHHSFLPRHPYFTESRPENKKEHDLS
jgi:hypothetical protein